MTKEQLKELGVPDDWNIGYTVTPPKPTCIDAGEWLREDDEPDNPLVEGLIEVGEMVAVVGQSKAGKSLLALQLAVCIALGIPFLGRETRQANVYVANLEVSTRQYKKRLRRVVGRLGVNAEDIAGRLFIDNMKGESSSWNTCFKRARENGCDVVLVDPFYQIFKGEETDAKDCQRAIDCMKIFQRSHMTLIVVFHSPKGFSGDRQLIDMISGSSMLARFPESIIGLLNSAKDRDARVVKCVLRNYAPPDDKVIRYEDGMFVIDDSIDADVESAENRAKSKPKQAREETAAADFNRAIAFWGREIAERCCGIDIREVANEISRRGGFSKTKVNKIIYEIQRNAEYYGIRWDDEYGMFSAI